MSYLIKNKKNAIKKIKNEQLIKKTKLYYSIKNLSKKVNYFKNKTFFQFKKKKNKFKANKLEKK